MKTRVIVNVQIEGTHYWKGCDIERVSYLKNEHRHVFHICAKKEVSHNDRDIEIIQLKQNIKKHVQNRYGIPCQFKEMSCEMIAEMLIEAFRLDYCSVLEDGENGAEITTRL